MKAVIWGGLIVMLVAPVASAQLELRQNTPVTLQAGPFYIASNNRRATSLVLRSADIEICKTGSGAFAAKHDSADPNHVKAGIQDFSLDATDTNTRGPLYLNIADPNIFYAGADPNVLYTGPYEFAVIDPNEWDRKYSTTKGGKVDVWTVRGTVPPTTTAATVEEAVAAGMDTEAIVTGLIAGGLGDAVVGTDIGGITVQNVLLAILANQ